VSSVACGLVIWFRGAACGGGDADCISFSPAGPACAARGFECAQVVVEGGRYIGVGGCRGAGARRLVVAARLIADGGGGRVGNRGSGRRGSVFAVFRGGRRGRHVRHQEADGRDLRARRQRSIESGGRNICACARHGRRRIGTGCVSILVRDRITVCGRFGGKRGGERGTGGR